MRGRELAARYRPLTQSFVRVAKMLPLSARLVLWVATRYAAGTPGVVLRYILISSLAVRCGENVYVGPGAFILRPDRMEIGSNVSIHPMCYIDATGGLTIGDDVSVAHACTIMTTEHTFDAAGPIRNQPVVNKSVHLASDIWIAAGVRILGGARISQRTVVGAAAVVKGNIGPGVYVGVPARRVRLLAASDGPSEVSSSPLGGS